MIAIRAFIQQIVYVAIVAIIIELILPKGNTKKYVFVILSLFILLNIVSPIINIIKDSDLQNTFNSVLETISSNVDRTDNRNIDEFSAYKNVKITSEVEEELSKNVNDKLNKMNVKFKNLKIILNDDYTIKSLKINIENLNDLDDRKVDKISSIISSISTEYSIDENVISVVEEGV